MFVWVLHSIRTNLKLDVDKIEIDKHYVSLRKGIVIFFISIFSYIQFGYYIQYWFDRNEAKRDFSQLLKSLSANYSEGLLVDTFSYNEIKADIKWEEEGKEFWYRGQLYDILCKKTENGKTYLYCRNDSKEERVVKNYMDSTRKNVRSGQQKNSITFFSPLFVNHVVPVINLPVLIANNNFAFINQDAISQFYAIISPPPRC